MKIRLGDKEQYINLLRLRNQVNAALKDLEKGRLITDENAGRYFPKLENQQCLFRLGEFTVTINKQSYGKR